jgi:hypothetical protein
VHDRKNGLLRLPDQRHDQELRRGVQHEDGLRVDPELGVDPKLNSPSTSGIRRRDDPSVPSALADPGLRRPCFLDPDKVDAGLRELLLEHDPAGRPLDAVSLFPRPEGEHVGRGHQHCAKRRSFADGRLLGRNGLLLRRARRAWEFEPWVLRCEHLRPKKKAVQLQLGTLQNLRQPKCPEPREQLAVRELARATHVGDDVGQLVARIAAVASDVPELRQVLPGPGLELRPGDLGKDVVGGSSG